MIDLNTVEKSISSCLPPSMERAADILRKALRFFPELKKTFPTGNPEEKKHARRIAQSIIDRVNEEIRKTCELLSLNFTTFSAQIVSCFSPGDALLYQEAQKWLRSYHREIFAPIRSSSIKPIKPAVRLLC